MTDLFSNDIGPNLKPILFQLGGGEIGAVPAVIDLTDISFNMALTVGTDHYRLTPIKPRWKTLKVSNRTWAGGRWTNGSDVIFWDRPTMSSSSWAWASLRSGRVGFSS